MKVLNSYKICLSKKTGILCGFYKFLNVLFEIAQQVKLCLEKKVVHITAGRKVLINEEKFINFLNGEQEV